jgi:hypothetical protein
MKILSRQQDETNWFEIKGVTPTTDQQTILQSGTDEQKLSVMKSINEQRKVIAQDSDAAIAEAAYEANKPALKETDVYQYIATDMTIDDNGKASGIINCRINGEHKQIRF